LPRAFGRAWPQYRVEWTDLLAMIGAGELESLQREANRSRVLPSAKEISQMERAIAWPMEHLRDERHVLIVNVCARIRSIDGDLAYEIKRRKYDGEADAWRRLNWTLCDTIADALIGKRVMVF
jgi:hypothetical protein